MTATEAATPETNHVAEFDFDHLQIENQTAKFEMPMVAPEAFLVVRPATPENKQFNAASLRMSGKRQRQIVQKGSLSSADADADRREDRILYPKYIVVGWGGIEDKSGNPVKFTFENCKAFIAKLPTWIFDQCRVFCMRPERFLSDDDLQEQEEPNPVAVAGN